jgi:hypothetical protein
MAKHILAVSSRPSNPVSHLAYLINAALEERCSSTADIPTDYQQQLCTLMGLSFTAVMAEGSRTRSCRPHLAAFLRYSRSTQHQGKFERLSLAIAEMVCNAIYPFKMLGFPRYYDDFMLAMTHTLSPSNTVTAKIKDAVQDVLLELLEKCG